MPGTRLRGFVIAGALATAVLWPGAAAQAGGGCHGGTTEGTGEVVTLVDACFDPTLLRVDPGTKVTFVNKDPIVHTVTASEWGSPDDLLQGDTISATFDEEGTFPYACSYHPGMTGAIVVGDGAGDAPAASVDTGAIVDTTPVSAEQAATTEPEGSGILGWAIAGLIGLLIGAGAMGMVRGKPQED